MQRIILFAVILLLATTSAVFSQQKFGKAPARSWTGPVFGGATIEAAPVSFDGKNLTLKTEGGELNVPLAKLSDADQEYVRSLLKNSAKSGTKTASFARGNIDLKKYEAHIPKGNAVKRLAPGELGSPWIDWDFCASLSSDDKTLVLSRFTKEKWMLSYDREKEKFGKVFETPGKDNFSVAYHVVSSKESDKCYAAFQSKEVCEYSIPTGRILRRINIKEYPDDLLLNKNDDKLYIGGTPAVWDLKTNRVTQLADFDADCVALDSKENQLAYGVHDSGAIMIFNANTRKTPQTIAATGKNVWSMRFVGDDKFLLIGTSEPATVSLISLSTGKPVLTIGGFGAKRISHVFCTADESLLFVVQSATPGESEPTIIFDTKTMLPVCMFDGSYHMKNAALTSDEKTLILPTCGAFSVCEVPDRAAIDATIEKLKEIR